MKPYFAHETAVIDEGVRVGNATKIWHFVHIMQGAVIGQGCTIGDYVFVGEGVKIGAGCKIQNNVYLPPGLILEGNVFIGPGVVFTNVRDPRASINKMAQVEQTFIREGVTIGANATILPGITINEYAFIGAGAVVTKNVGPYHAVVGNPAMFHCVVGKEGARERPYDPAVDGHMDFKSESDWKEGLS